MKHYLCVGTDKRSLEARDKVLSQTKGKLFSSVEANRFDLDELDARKLSTQQLQAACAALPVASAQRLVVVFQAEKLSKECVEALAVMLSEGRPMPVLFLIAESWPKRTNAHKEVLAVCELVGEEAQSAGNVFGVMDALRDPAIALRTLKTLLDQDDAPEQLLGGMLWAWSNKWKTKIPADKYKKGLLVLQEADDRIKRSRLPKREQAIEIAVVKLSLLLTS